MSLYPDEVQKRCQSPSASGAVEAANAEATGASFVCGAFVRVAIRIDQTSGTISAAGFATNGCGYMTATSDLLCEWLRGNAVRDLRGLTDAELSSLVHREIGDLPAERQECGSVVFETLRSAMAAYRLDRAGEFAGDKALICTCFGVDEDALAKVIVDIRPRDIHEVMRHTRAGTGCGSCRMLIEEMIETSE